MSALSVVAEAALPLTRAELRAGSRLLESGSHVLEEMSFARSEVARAACHQHCCAARRTRLREPM